MFGWDLQIASAAEGMGIVSGRNTSLEGAAYASAFARNVEEGDPSGYMWSRHRTYSWTLRAAAWVDLAM